MKKTSHQPSVTLQAMRAVILSLMAVAGFVSSVTAGTVEPYAGMLEHLRAEIAAALPPLDDATRKGIVEAKDAKLRVKAVSKAEALDKLLSGDALDAKLVKHFILHDATPAALAAHAAQGPAQKKRIDALLADDRLMLQIAIADGARPVHAGKSSSVPNYGKAMEIYTAIRDANPKAKEGVHQRLALAVALEFSEAAQPDEDAGGADSKANDPVKRFQHFVKAYEAGELDPSFDRLSVWELRFVVCAPESDEALSWGREMLRNYRPDHIYTADEAGRYSNVVNTDVRYGSIDVGKDRPELFGVQNILMNGGICGRRSFFARYICRAFGIPATARPSTGHGASARWTPQVWVVVLGPGWGGGRSTTRYRNDRDFLATTQARARSEEFLKVKRAYWIGDVVGEKNCYAEFDPKAAPAFWNAVALATQRRIIDDSKAATPDARSAKPGKADGKTATATSATDAAKISRGGDGTITVPAAAFTPLKDDDDDVIAMKSFGGGMQVFLPRFLQQKPMLVRGGRCGTRLPFVRPRRAIRGAEGRNIPATCADSGSQ